MAMIGGSVTVADSEVVGGDGLALAIYNQIAFVNGAQLAAISSAFGSSIQDAENDEIKVQLESQRDAQRVALLREWAKTANALGPAIVAYIQSNARVSLVDVKATVSTSARVGTVPNPVVAGNPIDPPGTAVDLPVTGAGGEVELTID